MKITKANRGVIILIAVLIFLGYIIYVNPWLTFAGIVLAGLAAVGYIIAQLKGLA